MLLECLVVEIGALNAYVLSESLACVGDGDEVVPKAVAVLDENIVDTHAADDVWGPASAPSSAPTAGVGEGVRRDRPVHRACQSGSAPVA